MVAVAGALSILGALAVGVVVAARGPVSAGRTLRRAALSLSVLVAVLLAPHVAADSGWAAAYLLGVPIVGALIPVVADRAGRLVPVADATGATVITVWAFLLALGIGLVFLPIALLLFVALPTGLSAGMRRA